MQFPIGADGWNAEIFGITVSKSTDKTAACQWNHERQIGESGDDDLQSELKVRRSAGSDMLQLRKVIQGTFVKITKGN